MPSIHSRFQSIRDRLRQTSQASSLLATVWFLSGMLTIFIPLLTWGAKKNQFRNYNYEYNQAQANANYNYQQQNPYRCKWYQWNCYYAEDGGERQYMIPGWFRGWTPASDEEREQALAAGKAPGGIGFVYTWQLLMFIAILYYGGIAIANRRSVGGLLAVVFVWANLSFLSMFMVAQAIGSDDRALEQVGFYGQFPVLMFMADFWYTLFGAVFSVALFIRNNQDLGEKRAIEAAVETEMAQETKNKTTEPSTGYRAYIAPKQARPDAPTKPDPEEDDDYVKVI